MINHIDSKLPSFRSYMAEQRLNSGTSAKTTIDQSAIGGNEQMDVSLNLEQESTADQEARNKKKKEEEMAFSEDEQKKNAVALSDTEIQSKILRMLFAL